VRKKLKVRLHEYAELMLLGFISLLLTVGQSLISRICISEKVAGTFHPCTHTRGKKKDPPPLEDDDYHNNRHILASVPSDDNCAAQVFMYVGLDPLSRHTYIFLIHFCYALNLFNIIIYWQKYSSPYISLQRKHECTCLW